jgi:hypothetical protein
MKRETCKAEFTKEGTLPWQCPRCSVSRLRVKAGSLHEGETRESKANYHQEGWEPEWIEGRFSCLMECSHCKGDVSVAGTYRVQDDRFHDPEHGEGGDYESYYRPHFFSESPLLIDIPEKTPLEVIRELEIAFRLFWGIHGPAQTASGRASKRFSQHSVFRGRLGVFPRMGSGGYLRCMIDLSVLVPSNLPSRKLSWR